MQLPFAASTEDPFGETTKVIAHATLFKSVKRERVRAASAWAVA